MNVFVDDSHKNLNIYIYMFENTKNTIFMLFEFDVFRIF